MKLSAPIYQLKRRAKLMARDQKIALHTALDRIASEEGFTTWSLLSARAALRSTPREMLARLADGDLLLLGARPGHGKTLLGLQLLLDAVHQGRRGVFFTLEYTEQETRERIRLLEDKASDLGGALEIVISDDICADYIISHLAGAPPGTVATVDYLQILDQKRNKPELSEQISALRAFARQTGVILAFISQIDRSYSPDTKPLPDIQDIRLPNRLDVTLFSKACFLHDEKMQFQAIA
ncbi:ATPase domain-containing protein [Hyphomicrobiales bacterium]|nr:ATPase domain-containing protein [Hyphomicrobiales bacterium]CAH1667471.1 ATPase domain-containing protein [Hyphomicrobiales bacterium]